MGYVKHNALAGRPLASFDALQKHLMRWAVEVADQRIHGTTNEQPCARFEPHAWVRDASHFQGLYRSELPPGILPPPGPEARTWNPKVQGGPF